MKERGKEGMGQDGQRRGDRRREGNGTARTAMGEGQKEKGIKG
jgi:hypothetical protein